MDAQDVSKRFMNGKCGLCFTSCYAVVFKKLSTNHKKDIRRVGQLFSLSIQADSIL